MNSIALVVPANLWYSPYVKIYMTLLDSWSIEYDIIYWDRFKNNKEEGIVFKGNGGRKFFEKLIGYYRFSRFVKRQLEKRKYSKVIVFTSQAAIFLYPYLIKHFNKKYILDFRDLSIEQKPIFNKIYNRLLQHSYANVISSNGFKNCLPKGIDYILSHNFIVDEVRKAIRPKNIDLKIRPIEILTIGGIRHYETNALIMSIFGNISNYKLRFVGIGPAVELLKSHMVQEAYNNIDFEGYYDKGKEPSIISQSTIINILFPNERSHQVAMSNRFYHSLIYRRPMIVTKGQIQGDYCEKYNLGVTVDINNVGNVANILKNWLSKFDPQKFDENCIFLLKSFLSDYDVFKNMLRSFCN